MGDGVFERNGIFSCGSYTVLGWMDGVATSSSDISIGDDDTSLLGFVRKCV